MNAVAPSKSKTVRPSRVRSHSRASACTAAGLALLVGLASVAVANAGDAATATTTNVPPASSAIPDRIALIREQHLPNVELVTQDGRKMRFYDDLVKGKVVAINFMFVSCRDSCPLSTQHLVAARRSLGDVPGRDVTFLSITLDPEHDTPEVLRAYAEAQGAGAGWYFLTGKLEDIELLRRRLGAYDPDPVIDADRTQHAGLVILGNEPKGRWKAISALVNPVRIRQAIERTILPASQWPVGAAVVDEVPYEESRASARMVGPVDLSSLPPRD